MLMKIPKGSTVKIRKREKREQVQFWATVLAPMEYDVTSAATMVPKKIIIEKRYNLENN